MMKKKKKKKTKEKTKEKKKKKRMKRKKTRIPINPRMPTIRQRTPPRQPLLRLRGEIETARMMTTTPYRWFLNRSARIRL